MDNKNKDVNITNVINIFETFSGIGAQHKAIYKSKKLSQMFKIKRTSDWDARAIISYALIHNNKKFYKKLQEVKGWDIKKINDYLKQYNFSLDSKKILKNISSKEFKFKEHLIAANIVNNNIPDIQQTFGEHLKNIDLLTYSFPCQGLSIANMGRGEGIKENSNSTSKLVWEIKRILEDAEFKNIPLPKYLLLENVINLISDKHKKDYKKWIKFLESKGYVTFDVKIDATKFESIQKRKRLIAISILKDKMNQKFVNFTNQEFENYFYEKYSSKKFDSLQERKKHYYQIFNSSSLEEKIDATPNNTPSRVRMAEQNIDLLKDVEKNNFYINTLTTKQDRHPNIGMIEVEKEIRDNYPNKLYKRLITPRESFLIMGFKNKDFDNLVNCYKNKILTKESLYRQAGNSIVVSILDAVFNCIYNMEKE